MFTTENVFHILTLCFILTLARLTTGTVLSCHDCTGPQCSRAIATGTGGKCTAQRHGRCFIRIEADGALVHGCADKTTWSQVNISYVGCRYQNKVKFTPQGQGQLEQVLWCLCDTRFCNADISHFNALGLHSASPQYAHHQPPIPTPASTPTPSNRDAVGLSVAGQLDEVYRVDQPPTRSKAPGSQNAFVRTNNNMNVNVLRELPATHSVQLEQQSNNQFQQPRQHSVSAATWQNQNNLQNAPTRNNPLGLSNSQVSNQQQRSRIQHIQVQPKFQQSPSPRIDNSELIEIQLQDLPQASLSANPNRPTNQFQNLMNNFPQSLQQGLQSKQQTTSTNNFQSNSFWPNNNQAIQFQQIPGFSDQTLTNNEPEYGAQDIFEAMLLLKLANILTNNYDDNVENLNVDAPSGPSASQQSTYNNFPVQQSSDVDGYQLYVPQHSVTSLKERDSNNLAASKNSFNVHVDLIPTLSSQQRQQLRTWPIQFTSNLHRTTGEEQNFQLSEPAGNRIDLQKLGFNKRKQLNNKLTSKQQPVSDPVVAQQPTTFDNSKLKRKTIHKKRKQSQQLENDKAEPISSDNVELSIKNTSAINLQEKVDLRSTFKEKLRQKLLAKLQLTQSNDQPPTVLEATDDLLEASIPVEEGGKEAESKVMSRQDSMSILSNDAIANEKPEQSDTEHKDIISESSSEVETASNIDQGQGQQSVAREIVQVDSAAPEKSLTAPIQHKLMQENATNAVVNETFLSNLVLKTTVIDAETGVLSNMTSSKEVFVDEDKSDALSADATGDLSNSPGGNFNRSLDIQSNKFNLSSVALKSHPPNVSTVSISNLYQPLGPPRPILNNSNSNLDLLNVSSTHSSANESHLSANQQSVKLLPTNQNNEVKFSTNRFLQSLPNSFAALFVTTTTETTQTTDDVSSTMLPLRSVGNISTAEFRNLFLSRQTTTVPSL